MDSTEILVRFVGEEVADGTMDVQDLGPALVAFARMTQAASRALNGDKVAVVVRISKDTEHQSFGINLSMVDVNAALGTAGLLISANYVSLQDVLAALSGAWERIGAWWEDIKAKDPAAQPVTLKGDRGAMVQQFNAGGDMHVQQIIMDPDTTREMLEAMRPVERKGIDKIEITDKRRKQKYPPIRKVNSEAMRAFVPVMADPSTTRVVRVTVLLDRPAFRNDLTWTFEQRGKRPWGATIEDPVFLSEVDRKTWKPEKGDIYDLEMRVVRKTLEDGSARTERTVLRVVDKAHGDGRQLHFGGRLV